MATRSRTGISRAAALSRHHAVESEGELHYLSPLLLARGKAVFRDGAGGPPCSSCGCELLNGRRNGEHAEETAARTGGSRAEIVDRQIACAGCGRVRDVADAGPITADEAELLGVAS